jgi:hypothetical protein
VFATAPVAVRVPERDELVDVRARLVVRGGDEADVVVTFASGEDGWRAWKPRTAAVPKAVAEITMGARFMVRCS